tara:strand:+ start:129 stop:1058 length:930 start_codon:yes stop_codon:yes gene_type:complete
MSLLICLPESLDTGVLKKELLSIETNLKVEISPEEVKNNEKVEFAVVWNHPSGILLKYPNLKAILAYGHGVDSVIKDTKLPKGVPIVRLKSEAMAYSMNEYLLAVVLLYKRRLNEHLNNSEKFEWGVSSRLNINSIGILGLGFLGKSAANYFSRIGFNVSGWSRTKKKLKNIRSFTGNKGLINMLRETDFLINLLPLTAKTKFLLNAKTLSKLKRGSFLINAGRGETLKEIDLIPLLDSGNLSGACLDVFQTEPLPKKHPFWKHKKILITPHNSSITPHSSAAPQIVENYRRAISGKKLLNLVNLKHGY